MGSAWEWDEWLSEFNRLAETEIPIEHFQGIYGGECHVVWVRRLLFEKLIRPAQNVTRDELIEVTRRAMPQNGDPDFEAYERILDVNTDRPQFTTDVRTARSRSFDEHLG